jgi:hypothetical protein
MIALRSPRFIAALPPPPRVLVACEESQAVTIELRRLGIHAFSCDIEPCSGGHPEWHIRGDVLPILNDGWEMIVAFPPCTHLAAAGAPSMEEKRRDGRQHAAIEFFMAIARADCRRIAIENPVGIMSSVWRSPNQIINPWQFGDSFSKKTCLWLKGLPPLRPTKIVDKGEHTTYKSGCVMPTWYAEIGWLPAAERAAIRSKTFPGIARAMAEQWGGELLCPSWPVQMELAI